MWELEVWNITINHGPNQACEEEPCYENQQHLHRRTVHWNQLEKLEMKSKQMEEKIRQNGKNCCIYAQITTYFESREAD